MGDDARDHGWACMSFASYHNAYRSRDELLTEMMQRIVDGEMARWRDGEMSAGRSSRAATELLGRAALGFSASEMLRRAEGLLIPIASASVRVGW